VKLTTSVIAKVFVTDTVQPAEQPWPTLHVVAVAPLLADAIRRIISDGSRTQSLE
jgi:phosphoribosylpyrophosphate synthetase